MVILVTITSIKTYLNKFTFILTRVVGWLVGTTMHCGAYYMWFQTQFHFAPVTIGNHSSNLMLSDSQWQVKEAMCNFLPQSKAV